MLIGLFFNKSGFWRSQEIQDLWLANALVEAGAGQDICSYIPSNLRNAIPCS